MSSECSESRGLFLAGDRRKINLERKRCYAVSFTLSLSAVSCEDKHAVIGIQTIECGKKTNRFTVYSGEISKNIPATVSASGIYISTFNSLQSVELALTLLSPCEVIINQSSIYVTEV